MFAPLFSEMNYRATRCYQNCEKAVYEGAGQYDIPIINPIEMDVENVPLIGFNYALTERHPENKILHFFVDDYQFERVWYRPDAYLNLLRKFKAVISPDFSIYSDFPNAIRIYNVYRSQWLGAYFQENGVNVIPNVMWSDESSFDYCFDGTPRNALVCISTVGSFGNYGDPEGWMKGYKKALEVLNPSYILLYGKKYPQIEIPCKYSVAVNQNTLDRKLARHRMDEEAKKEAEKAVI